ncbi:MAG: nitronate monooxygenase [Deltaproteobacteria bacterium]|nr:nitronate monooxygenase [Deltaproteobacteria bacterium]
MKRTRICPLLGIDYPILQGGMLWLATAELAAAVSNAGGLGVISPYAGMEQSGDPTENLRDQIIKARALTECPFGVNIPLDLESSGLLIDVALRQKVRIVVTAAGSPDTYTAVLHDAGITVLHVVSTVAQARFSESSGVDCVIAEGYEAAGRVGVDEVPLFSLVPQIADAVGIPIIAAGGIADARGVVAAFALGAEGVQLGTRFIAAEENMAHPRYKEAIVQARDTDTVVTSRVVRPRRNLKTAFTEQLMTLDKTGAAAQEIVDVLGYRSARQSQLEGDLAAGEASCGASAGLINDIVPAATIIKRLIEGYEEVVKELTREDK